VQAHNSVLFDVSASVNLMMKESRWKALKRKNIEKEGNIKQFEVGAHRNLRSDSR